MAFRCRTRALLVLKYSFDFSIHVDLSLYAHGNALCGSTIGQRYFTSGFLCLAQGTLIGKWYVDQRVTDRAGVRTEGGREGGGQFPTPGDSFDRRKTTLRHISFDRTWLNASYTFIQETVL